MKKIVAIIILAFVAFVGIWRVSVILKTRAQAKQKGEEILTVVEVEPVKQGTIQEKLSLVGNIVADSEVTVYPKIAGKIEQIFVDEGSNVTKGSVLAKLEDKELLLRVKQAEVALNTAKIVYEQTKALAEVKVKAQVAQAEAAFISADAARKQVRDLAKTRVSSQLESATAGLEALKTNLKKIKDGARPEEKKQIQATVQQAKANMDNANADLDRMQKLFDEGAISKQTLDAAKTRATVASAQYEAAQQQLKLVETGAREEDIRAMELQVKQAESGLEVAKVMAETRSWEQDIQTAEAHFNQAKAGLETAKALEKAKSWEAEIASAEAAVKQAETALELAKEALSYATITAPISGTISKRSLDVGSMANPAIPLFTIVNVKNVKAIVDITEANLYRISPSSKVSVSVAGLPDWLTGQITLISPIIKPGSRTAEVEISIDNSSQKIKPGAFARVDIILDTHYNVFLVRRSAILEDKINSNSTIKYVYVLEGNKSVRKNIETGIIQSDIAEVLSGLNRGENVIVSGQNQIKDGEKVKLASIL
ncbi:MAG: efflux RND transporter periplasmic adaptor subunit [bacterium]